MILLSVIKLASVAAKLSNVFIYLETKLPGSSRFDVRAKLS